MIDNDERVIDILSTVTTVVCVSTVRVRPVMCDVRGWWFVVVKSMTDKQQFVSLHSAYKIAVVLNRQISFLRKIRDG